MTGSDNLIETIAKAICKATHSPTQAAVMMTKWATVKWPESVVALGRVIITADDYYLTIHVPAGERL